MCGLVLKDFMNLGKPVKQYIVMFLAMTVVAFVMENPSFISMYIILCSSMLLISTFNYDEYVQFDLYVCGLPVSRKDIVKAKYIVLVLLTSIPAIAGTLLSIILNCFIKTEAIPDLICFGMAEGCFFCIGFAVMIPFIYYLGAEKARMITVGIWIVLFGAGYLVIKTLTRQDIPAFLLAEGTSAFPVIAVMLIAAAAVVLLSYFASRWIMSKKEF